VYTDSPSPMSNQDQWTLALTGLFDLFRLTEPNVRHLPMVDATLGPRVLPAVQYLPAALGGANPVTRPACELLAKLQHLFDWSQNTSYTDQEFLRGYAYCAFVGPNGHIPHRGLALGLLLLQPQMTYPEHVHPAKETYVVLSGNALWKQGDGIWRERGSGELINHASMESHAMRTQTEPLLAAYLWHDHLNVGAQFVDALSVGYAPAPALHAVPS
jgi:hypothetical protein